jgi:hypothetical protein
VEIVNRSTHPAAPVMMAFLPANRPLACVLLIVVEKEYQKRFRTPSSVLALLLSRTRAEELISVYDSTDGVEQLIGI